MRVLITVPALEMPGGVATHYRTVRPYLDAQKVFLEIGARPKESGGWAALRRLIADYRRFHRELGARPYDLVHVNPSLGLRSVLRDGLLLLIAKAHGLPVIVFFHGWDALFAAVVRRGFRRLFQAVYDRADNIVVLAQEFRSDLRSLGLKTAISVETTAVDETYFTEGSDRAASASSESHACGLLYLSRIDRGKGVCDAIDAVTRLQQKVPSITLTIAGEGPERAAAEAMVREHKIKGITFIGHVEGTRKVQTFCSSDVYFFPTNYGEGMPVSVLEAMAFGLPVVTRPVGGLRDFFEDGRMGYVTESRDPAVFAELLLRLVRDPDLRHRMGQYNREYARNRFAASVVARRLLAIYEQVGRPVAVR